LLFKLLKLVVALWCIGLTVFIYRLPSEVPAAPLGPGEGVVVPTGGAARIATGFDLMAQGAQRLLITGVHPDTTLAALAAETGLTVDPCCIDLDHAAPDTIGNAAFAAEWAKKHQFTTIRLVTSWYHMPRSLVLFERAMPGTTIIAHPVFPANPPRDGWWQSGLAWRLVVVEYVKLLWAWTSPGPEA
jgi:uncharacterized SAM-binding protein YcdF (DUF218 family)